MEPEFSMLFIPQARADESSPVEEKNPREITEKCFMNITIDGVEAGRIVLGLYGNAVPKTVKNFAALCTGSHGLGYKGTEFYRIVSGLTVQGGDVTGSHGRSGKSIYGSSFPAENFEIKHDVEGTLSMARTKDGEADSRFFITTREDSGYLDGKFVALGRVVAGMEVVKRIEGVKATPPTNKPQKSIVISNCGIL